jgi:hypothetical protein
MDTKAIVAVILAALVVVMLAYAGKFLATEEFPDTMDFRLRR